MVEVEVAAGVPVLVCLDASPFGSDPVHPHELAPVAFWHVPFERFPVGFVDFGSLVPLVSGEMKPDGFAPLVEVNVHGRLLGCVMV